MSFIDLPGSRLFYVDEGSGNPPLVFIHGFTCSHEDWRWQSEFFRGRRRVVMCDLRGHGHSTARAEDCNIETLGADVSRLLEALDLPPAILIGHSLGCRVVLQTCLDAPERFAGVVLVDGSCIAEGDPAAAEAAVRESFRVTGYSTTLNRLFADMFSPLSNPATRERIMFRAQELPEAIGTELMPRQAGWDARNMERALSRLSVPLLVIQSTYFNMQRVRVPLEPGANTPWLDLVRRCFPAAQIEVVGGAGHFTMLDAPDAVNRLIENFPVD